MRRSILTAALAAAPLALFAATPLNAHNHDHDDDRDGAQAADDPGLEVSEERLRADMDTIVGFGTRHTLSSQTDPERGIGAAVDWALAEFGRIGAECGGCLDVMPVGRVVEADGRRIPEPTLIRNAVAIQRGTERPDEVIIVQAHYDSRVTDAMNATDDAPGANDDGSGSVMVLEAARILSQREYPSTIIYALLTGEEQGLYGAGILADSVAEQGMTVKAVLNNDMIGNSCGSDGFCDAEHVRVFSEGLRADSTPQLRAAQRRFGGENDSPGRNLSRWLNSVAEDFPDGMQVRQIWRTDRMGRGGDQIPFLDRGYPAVRVTVAVEDYEHQHQDLRVEDGITYGDTVDELDFDYLTRSSVLNVRALDRLASAPMPPQVTADAAVRTDTLVEWQGVEGATTYLVVKRRTDESDWRWDEAAILSFETPVGDDPTPMAGRELTYTAPLRGDDWIFGVASCSFGPVCSPVSSAVPGGAFYPLEGDSED
ncbi:M28 family peptidase [Aurantiacibacter sediminis]|uniref:M28 family peptidase n=1 Tax=Aurantiacibacter sediminis TaxID=2793064 RepID=A0ABS0N3R6_9SPHN|nr:M28 family peptidase [Aurantiacibacter sediminis]MBH5322613.1 M28 family peptidase [Aurantiacibacter sediminis]